MKPLYTLTASAPSFAVVMQNIAAIASYALKDRPFRYLDTTVVPEMSRMQVVLYSVSMIFEAESQDDIQELNVFFAKDPTIQKFAGNGQVVTLGQ
jgi:hypothetical protein